MRCLEHCVQQLTQLTGLLDAVLTKCCNLIVPDGEQLFLLILMNFNKKFPTYTTV